MGDREEVGDDGRSPCGASPAGRDETTASQAIGEASRNDMNRKLSEECGPQRGIRFAVPEPMLEALRAS